MESLASSGFWDFLDYSFIADDQPADFLWSNNSVMDVDFSGGGAVGGNDEHANGDGDGDGASEVKEEKECPRKRERTESCSKQGSKAYRGKLRRERLNDRFMDLCSVLEPWRPTRTDKPAILDDAIRVLNQLKDEAQELKETNEKLLEEIKSLKAEKNDIREEKLVLKSDKERMEQQLKTMAMQPSGFMPAHPAAYQNKMAVYPSYSLVPMWHYLPPSTRDTSHDHELRPPAA
ncbi:transcription factor bHLH104 isoform X1 [Morus notabilis]|uniref:transcription factor bHLH104 isoform X1 n=1 Tax=Morus notabilis TaxID=981085 RepID=UPI000CECFE5A|nr:transcription factor bHLH104 isoform X1 [Morus notabilis]